MNPDHNSFTPSRSTESQRLTPHLTFITTNALNLLALLLLPTFDVLEVARDPLLLTALMHEFGAVLLERCHSVQRELAVGSDQLRGPRDHHWRDGLVGLEEVFYYLGGHGDEVGFDVFGVLDDGFRVDHRGEGLG